MSTGRPLPGLPDGIGARLREERDRLGFTQDALAEQLGMVRKTLYNYEAGATSIPVDFLDGLLDSEGTLST